MSPDILAGKKILVVEDEFLVAMLVEETLQDHGCVVVGPLTNLTDAMRALDGPPFDAAVIDVNLRGEKIYPLAEALDRMKIPFLLVSGYGREAVPHDRAHWIVCEKPFRGAQLAAMLADRLLAV